MGCNQVYRLAKELIGGQSKYTDVQASLSGGNSNTQFLISANLHRETTVFPGDFSDQKGSIHINYQESFRQTRNLLRHFQEVS